MLKEFVESNHYKFAEEASDWEEAIRMSCECLEADGTVVANYKADIIECVKKYGPYIVIMPNVAMCKCSRRPLLTGSFCSPVRSSSTIMQAFWL